MKKISTLMASMGLLVLCSCSAGISRYGYEIQDLNNTSNSSSRECHIAINNQLAYDKSEVEVLGSIEAYDTSISVICSEAYVLDLFAKDACALGADAVNITEEKYPSFWSTCYRAKAEFLRFKKREQASLLTSDTKYGQKRIVAHPQRAEFYNAVYKGDKKKVEELLKNGADVDMPLTSEIELTPLMVASQEGQIEIIELLLLYRADINKRTLRPKDSKFPGGGTALIFASGEGKSEAVKYLLEHGASIDDAADNGVTALITASDKGHLEVVNLLLSHGANANLKTEGGATALIPAIVGNHADVVETLLDCGADANAKKYNGTTPLIIASSLGNIGMVKSLIMHGADINVAGEKGMTALMVATVQSHSEVVEILLDHGADIDAGNVEGSTALMLAADIGNINLIKLLLNSGADVTLQNADGLTAISLAQIRGFYEIASILNLASSQYYRVKFK